MCKVIETTTMHNKVYRTFRHSSCGADTMCKPNESKAGHWSNDYERPDGLEVFHWPEFQALAKRLMIDTDAPIRNVTIKVPYDGVVVVTVETLGLDKTKKKE